MKYKCLSWNKDYSNKTDEESKKRFIKNTFKISNNDINKFILLLREHVYPYEYMDEWEKLMKYYHLKKKEFCSNLNIDCITDTDDTHVKRVSKDF